MSTLEKLLWARARSHLTKHRVLVERIENILGPGTPDVHGACHGVPRSGFWIENKAVAAPPARATTPLLGRSHGYSLNTEQVNWHLNYAKHGGRSFVLIGIGSHQALLVPGTCTIQLQSSTYAETVAMAAAHVRAPADWALVVEVLRGTK